MLSCLLFVTLLFVNGHCSCPFYNWGTPPNGTDYSIPSPETYNDALDDLNLRSVFRDLYDVLLTNETCWPQDRFNGEGSYAGLFLRLAWHAAGTFRTTDDKGGAAGGRQRFPPESSWDDNANLDYARALVAPLKETYGDALSWGDLFVFAGTAAILQGGGPVADVCAGRIDNTNGSLSDPLNSNATCNPDGNCTEPLGSSTVGLIYVNAQGFLGVPDPVITAPHIREIFGRMGMNDSEAVALIGGGHAFGKAHLGTSGIEGQWTKYPFQWDNDYFTQLLNDTYNLTTSASMAYQWISQETGYLMLTTDLAFLYDEEYYDIVVEYANNIDSLNRSFAAAWAKLTMSGGNMASNYFCVDGDYLRPGAVMTTTTETPMTTTTSMMTTSIMDEDNMTTTMMTDDMTTTMMTDDMMNTTMAMGNQSDSESSESKDSDGAIKQYSFNTISLFVVLMVVSNFC